MPPAQSHLLPCRGQCAPGGPSHTAWPRQCRLVMACTALKTFCRRKELLCPSQHRKCMRPTCKTWFGALPADGMLCSAWSHLTLPVA